MQEEGREAPRYLEFDQAFESILPWFGDAGGDDGSAAKKVLPRFVIEHAYAVRVRRHGCSPMMSGKEVDGAIAEASEAWKLCPSLQDF